MHIADHKKSRILTRKVLKLLPPEERRVYPVHTLNITSLLVYMSLLHFLGLLHFCCFQLFSSADEKAIMILARCFTL